MITKEQFRRVIDEIKTLGYDEATAGDFARRIGDMPEVNDKDEVVVRDDAGKVLAVLDLPFWRQ